MKITWHALLIIVISFFISSCNFGIPAFLWNSDDAEQRSTKITSLTEQSDTPYADAVSGEQSYSFVVITDVHFGADETRHDQEFLSWFAQQLHNTDVSFRPRFVVCLGDTADGGKNSELDDYNNTLVANIVSLGNSAWSPNSVGQPFKVYTILGNHDLYNDGGDAWAEKIYPHTSYYRFSAGGFSWYFLDTANGTLGSKQLSDFEDKAKNDSLPKIVFSHYPVYAGGNLLLTLQNTMERNRLITAFANDNVKYVFEGHTHYDRTFSFGCFEERITASYLYDRECCLVTVNRSTGAVSSQIINF